MITQIAKQKKSIGIIGGGFVGSAIRNYYEKLGHLVKVYDKYKDFHPVKEVLDQDLIFIAVPTPYKQGIDLSAMDEAMQNVSLADGGKTVVIKSTVIPGTTDKYQELYPHLSIFFNPEFLTELSSDNDFAYPDRQIMGYTAKSQPHAAELALLLPHAPYVKTVPAAVAELIKYFGNNWLSVKVSFANQMYDLCQKLGVDYNLVREGAAADKRIGPSHLDVWHLGYRGYAGKCLPKDVRAMIHFAQSHGIDMKILKAAEEVNNELTGGKV